MSDKPLLVRDLGEHDLLARLQRYCPREIVGDDGAILTIDKDKSLVVTTDVLVDEVHFSDRTTSAFDAGWRAVTANLSDLAAMGATPVGITIGLALPGKKAISWVESLYQGIKTCLDQHKTPLVGGDLCRSKMTTIAITAFGAVDPKKAIRRNNAKPGHAIVITGMHGLSRGGLEILLHPDIDNNNLEIEERARLIQAHQRPNPRLDVLTYLANIPADIAIAGMDSSDGLADAIVQICQSSNVGARIKRESLITFTGLSKLADMNQALSWILYGGEDFELVLSLPRSFAEKLVMQLGKDAKIIGEITQEKNIIFINQDNSDDDEILDLNQRFKHF